MLGGGDFMQGVAKVNASLSHIVHELLELKRDIVVLKSGEKNKSEEAWRDLLSLSDEITKLWKGPSAVEEIREQREKIWK